MPLKQHKATINYVKHCKTCKRIKLDNRRKKGPYLVDRIYKSQAWIKGGEPLTDIWRDYGAEDLCSYLAFRNHSMKHQAPSAEQLDDARMERITAEARDEQVQEIITTDGARKELIEMAMKALREGDLKLTAAHLLKAAKDQDDVDAKKKDQGLEAMKLIAAFQSGELGAGADEADYIDAEVIDVT